MEINIQIGFIGYLISLIGCYLLVKWEIKKGYEVGFNDVLLTIIPILNSINLVSLIFVVISEINTSKIVKKFFGIK